MRNNSGFAVFTGWDEVGVGDDASFVRARLSAALTPYPPESRFELGLRLRFELLPQVARKFFFQQPRRKSFRQKSKKQQAPREATVATVPQSDNPYSSSAQHETQPTQPVREATIPEPAYFTHATGREAD